MAEPPDVRDGWFQLAQVGRGYRRRDEFQLLDATPGNRDLVVGIIFTTEEAVYIVRSKTIQYVGQATGKHVYGQQIAAAVKGQLQKRVIRVHRTVGRAGGQRNVIVEGEQVARRQLILIVEQPNIRIKVLLVEFIAEQIDGDFSVFCHLEREVLNGVTDHGSIAISLHFELARNNGPLSRCSYKNKYSQ